MTEKFAIGAERKCYVGSLAAAFWRNARKQMLNSGFDVSLPKTRSPGLAVSGESDGVTGRLRRLWRGGAVIPQNDGVNRRSQVFACSKHQEGGPWTTMPELTFRWKPPVFA